MNRSHPDQIKYLEKGKSIRQNLGSIINRPDPCIKEINNCDEISPNIKNSILLFLHSFDTAILSASGKECLKNFVRMMNILVAKSCKLALTNTEIDKLLIDTAKINLQYYNIITADVYTVLFASLSNALKIANVTKEVYTAEMMKYANKVKIFFHDSYIFDVNFLTYATMQMATIKSDAIYPYQMPNTGLGADFISYFCYLHYLFNNIFLSISDVIRSPENDARLKTLVNGLPDVMQYYVFIPENITVIQSMSEPGNKPAPGIYARHNMSLEQASIIIALILVFITEIQCIFFDSHPVTHLACNDVSKMLCAIFGLNVENEAENEQCSKYHAMLRYRNSHNFEISKPGSNAEKTFYTRITKGFGAYRYDLLEYNATDIYKNINSSLSIRPDNFDGDISDDINKFTNTIKNLKNTLPNFNYQLCRTLKYLRTIKIRDGNEARDCIHNMSEFAKLIQDGIYANEYIRANCQLPVIPAAAATVPNPIDMTSRATISTNVSSNSAMANTVRAPTKPNTANPPVKPVYPTQNVSWATSRASNTGSNNPGEPTNPVIGTRRSQDPNSRYQVFY